MIDMYIGMRRFPSEVGSRTERGGGVLSTKTRVSPRVVKDNILFIFFVILVKITNSTM